MSTVQGLITLGQMTMYFALFRQGQSAVSSGLSAIGGMYEDNLYLSTLYEYLETEVPRARGENSSAARCRPTGCASSRSASPIPARPSRRSQDISLHLRPGSSLALVGENGSGKTTLIKLLTRLYEPTSGRVLLDGLDLREWDATKLRGRIGVIFQDFARYQLLVGENVGAGDEKSFEDEAALARGGRQGPGSRFHRALAGRLPDAAGQVVQGRSGAVRRPVAEDRAVTGVHANRRGRAGARRADGSSMDARAEAEVFEHFRRLASDRITILISHRFSTVRMADHIVVLDQGRIVEQGSHEELMQLGGTYASLFTLQAKGYR